MLLLLPLSACRESVAESAEWRGTVDTLPNGAEHLRNPSVGMWGNDDGWSIVEVMRLESMEAEGPERFGDVAAVTATCTTSRSRVSREPGGRSSVWAGSIRS